MDMRDEAEREASPASAPQSADVTNREATELTIYHSAATNASFSTKSQYQGHFGSVRKFWRRHVSLRVPHVKCRDHLGMLTTRTSTVRAGLDEPDRALTANERTFLAWIRTSIALSMLGTVIAQLFRLQNGPSPGQAISLYVLAIPLASICQGAALITALTGGHRYWRQQNAMARGQALASGWDFWLMIALSGSVSGPHLTSCESILAQDWLRPKKVLLILFVVILALA
jgi:uncharacterized membrane protein YidH (DUF202 family)